MQLKTDWLVVGWESGGGCAWWKEIHWFETEYLVFRGTRCGRRCMAGGDEVIRVQECAVA
jgi:hypothetical protein